MIEFLPELQSHHPFPDHLKVLNVGNNKIRRVSHFSSPSRTLSDLSPVVWAIRPQDQLLSPEAKISVRPHVIYNRTNFPYPRALRHVDIELFHRLKRIEVLILESNLVEKLPPLGSIKENIKMLWCGDNKIQEVFLHCTMP